MRLEVDAELCEGNGVCEQEVPAVFRIGDDDQVALRVSELDESMRSALERACQRCPRQALTLVD